MWTKYFQMPLLYNISTKLCYNAVKRFYNLMLENCTGTLITMEGKTVVLVLLLSTGHQVTKMSL